MTNIERLREMRNQLKVLVFNLNDVDATTSAAMVQVCIIDLQKLEIEQDNLELVSWL